MPNKNIPTYVSTDHSFALVSLVPPLNCHNCVARSAYVTDRFFVYELLGGVFNIILQYLEVILKYNTFTIVVGTALVASCPQVS